jgi:hypothetical protein
MWSIAFDRWEEKWFVAEYTRDPDAEGFFWQVDAERACADKNAKLHALPPTYDTEEANDVWPGGTVSYGGSRG